MSQEEFKVRVANAVLAMKAIGITKDKVKPVLKELLKLFKSNWALIEKENYQALTDAIYQTDELEAEEEAQATEEPERPLKRLRGRHQDGQTSFLNKSYFSMPKTPLVSPKEPDKLSKTHAQKRNDPEGIVESTQQNDGKTMTKLQEVTCHSPGSNKGKQPISSKSVPHDHERGDPSKSSINTSQQSTRLINASRSPTHPMKLRNRCKEDASLQNRSKEKTLVPESSSHVVHPLKEPKLESDILSSPKNNKVESHDFNKPKDEPITVEMSYPGVPNVIIDTDDKDARCLNCGAKVPQSNSTAPHCNGINGRPKLDKLDAREKILITRENQEHCGGEMNNLSLGTVQQPQLVITRPLHDVVDIAKGHENVVITLVNDVNDESPPSFNYIPQNAVFQNAYMNFSLARSGDDDCCATCSGDCLSSSIPCACSYETGGEFAYTADGLVKEEFLKECISMNRNPKNHCQFFCQECPLERSKCEDIIEPCKGHLVRKFIKECWRKCGCNKHCGNRVVQRGITCKLQVFMTQGKGWGLRTLEDLPKGVFVCEYVGEVLTNAELFERVLRKPKGEKHSYPVLLDADWCAEGVLKDEEALCLDATYYGNVARFINHKCYDSNLVEIPVEVDTPDHHYYHLAFFTTRKVKAMEELTWDYGIDFDDHEHPIKAFHCQCGSKFCRNIKRSRSRARR